MGFPGQQRVVWGERLEQTDFGPGSGQQVRNAKADSRSGCQTSVPTHRGCDRTAKALTQVRVLRNQA